MQVVREEADAARVREADGPSRQLDAHIVARKPPEECPDRHRYKACGNSMCVNVMRWIGKRIQQVEDKER